jgi:hypothetical protein
LQLGFGGLTPILTCLVAPDFFDRRTAFIAGLIVAVYGDSNRSVPAHFGTVCTVRGAPSAATRSIGTRRWRPFGAPLGSAGGSARTI